MPFKALQNYTYYSRYACYNEGKKRRETWNEAVDRMMDMHLRKYPEAREEIEWVRNLIKERRFLGSQRALQFGGLPIERKNSRLYNCSFAYVDRLRFFQEALWMLLCGSGVGYSVQRHHVNKLPEFSQKEGLGNETYIIPDSIEGWADALGILLATYFPSPEFSEWEGKTVTFDYSLIRPAGSPLASGVGKAPGPEPLKKALERIDALLQRCLTNEQTRLRPIDAHDIVLHASDAVLSGGVRRSSCIALFSPDDLEMGACKTGNWFYDNPQRARANNSAVLLRSTTTKEQFFALMKNVKEYGEPGFIWVDSLEAGFNPCVVGDTLIANHDGLCTALDLVKKPFEALVEGKTYHSTGFWKTGTKPTIKIDLQSGRNLILTEDHKVMTTSGWKKAKDLTSVDDIIINNHRDFDPIVDSSSADYARGYCLGNFLSDGNVSKDAAQMKWWGEQKDIYQADGLLLLEQAGWRNGHHKVQQETTSVYTTIESQQLLNFAKEKGCLQEGKHLSSPALVGSWSYLSGLIAGYFDGDGTVIINFKKGNSLRIMSADLENLQFIQIGLNAFGIFSKIYKDRNPEGFRSLPDGNGGRQDYHCEATHELIISCDNIHRFSKFISIRNKNKQDSLANVNNNYQRTPNRTHFIDHILNKTYNGIQDVYDCEVAEVHAFDANSIYVHNCCEIGLYAYDEDGNSGWQVCNLCEINGKKIKCKEDFALAARGAAILGTLQAGYTNFNYLGPVSEKIIRREALLGVSITGMMDNPTVIFDPEIQKEMALFIVETNEWVAKKIGINPAARATCVKPAGCQRPDIMIVSEKGILTLGELGREDGETWQHHNLFVLAAETYEKSNKFFVNGHAKTKKIMLATGVELECTPNHQYKVLRDGELQWVRADQIVEGDLLPYLVGGYENKNPVILKNLGVVHFNSLWNRSPKELNEDLCWLLGLYTGDGSNHARGIRIHGDKLKPSDLNRAASIILEQFGLESTIEPDRKGEGRLTLIVNSVDLVKWLKLNGVKKDKSSKVQIPKTVRMAAPCMISAFIDGYWCADGGLHPTNKTRSWVSTSKTMAQQLISVLRAIGQDCSMREMPPTKSSFGNKMRYWVQEKKGRTGNCYKSPMRKEFSALDSAGLENYTPDIVVSIQDSECMTLDIEVPNGNAYRANSYISHNTTSCILGTASGIHPHHAKRYLRRVQANALEPVLQYFKQYNPQACEPSVWSASGTDEVLTFVMEIQDGAKTKNQLSAIDLLEHVKLTQQNWVLYGKNKKHCTQDWLCHNVSNTINIRPNEWEEVADYIFKNRKWFAGISLLPMSGDLDYPQAPFTTVHTPNEILKEYGEGALFASGLIVDGLHAFDNNLWAACDAVVGLGQNLTQEPTNGEYEYWVAKTDWIRRVKQFAERYCAGDVKRTTYLLKEVNNWKTFLDLRRDWKNVPYEEMYEEENTVQHSESIACAGGQCSLVI